MENILPLILYKLDGSKFDTCNIITESPTIYFYSYQNFDVKILSGPTESLLYSVVQKQTPEGENYLDEHHGKEFTGKQNFGYTLFIPENNSTVIVQLTNIDGFKYIYTFTLNIANTVLETEEHYNDLIVNYYLPTIDELLPAMLENSNKTELIKRMLLDFKHIMRVRGTKASIEKFLYFIGFLPEQIRIYEEWKRNDTGSREVTINPDTTIDTKTGNYHVLFNNWNDENNDGKQELNSKNLPYRPFSTENIDSILESLKYAIPLANKYFTAIEQEITFFGICFSSNIPLYPSTTSLYNEIFYNDIFDFRKDLHINIYQSEITNNGNELRTYLVKNCNQLRKDCYRSEVKFKNKLHQNNELFGVEKIFYDNEIIPDDEFKSFERTFGASLYIDIDVPEKYNIWYKIIVKSDVNEFLKIIYTEKKEDLLQYLITATSGLYHIIIEIHDGYGNFEKYFYDYQVSDNISRIDIEIFNSKDMILNNENDITLDIDSGTLTTKPESTSKNYILLLDTIPDDLSKYFNVLPAGNIRYLTEASISKDLIEESLGIKKETSITKQYLISSINKNFRLSEVTDNIPIELSEQWLEFGFIPKTSKLSFRVYDVDTCEYKFFDLTDIEEAFKIDSVFDKLFIRTMKIIETNENNEQITNEYYFICSVETGIDLKHFNIYVDDELIKDENLHRIPVNFDFPLFPIDGDEFIYICKKYPTININDKTYPLVKSMFKRFKKVYPLTDMENITLNTNILMLGDVILARLNNNYIVNETNVTWNIFNTFTNELLFTTTDYMLKYRLDDNTIYTITCDFDIDMQHHKITKTGFFSSFKQELII